jgi:hypothetical protein
MADVIEPGLEAPAEQAVAVRQEPANMLAAVISRAATDPRVDATKAEALWRLHREIEDREAEREFNRAMNLAQAEIQPVARTAENTQTRSFYAKLEHVDAAIRPIYLRHGFSLSYGTVAPLVAGNIRIECRCAHVSGHTERYGREAPPDTIGPKGNPVKTVLHGGASTETFLKRYLNCGIFNVVFKDQDDDGVRGGKQTINADQLRELDELRRKAGYDLEAFCRFWNVETMLDLDVANFVPAMNGLSSMLARRSRQEGQPS